MEGMKPYLIHSHTKKKPMFHTFLSIFQLNDNGYRPTFEDTAHQSWPDYIGPKRENPQACLTNSVYALFP